ncbi:hypothetical protein QK290_09770 [Pseudarthrobacter sp. AL07]|uniref:hypothetical protein n=1 Tax=unclassified Pseudarthrobacter TaxID=2647000 RepID=UPI00249B2057|nr:MULTISPECIES: hypothetical protein [unclassified Pseudarthrobacter]MDI3194771.1 hypothetical protein [Pseudarthrobacter sp. AL20]MDI3208785.1 hypothetical protein [Pseudarthrobacter sp. AL07]
MADALAHITEPWTDWTGTASIVQLASRDLVTWEYLGAIDLDSPHVIDAAVAL